MVLRISKLFRASQMPPSNGELERRQGQVEAPKSGGHRDEHRWYKPFERVWYGFLELVGHLIMLLLVVGAFEVIEKTLEYAHEGEEAMFFNRLPIKYVFDAADAALLVGFLSAGVYFVLKAYLARRA